MNKILLSIIKKEFRHILRDSQTLVIILLMPILMLFLYGYAITLEMQQIETVIIDHSKSPESRQLIERIVSTDFFKVTGVDIPQKDFEEIFFKRQARCIFVIPEDFSRSLQSEFSTPLQLLIDATDPNAANYINNYLTQINTQFSFSRNKGFIGSFQVEPRILYNPDLKSSYFFVPGLIAVILLLICALLTSIAIVREKEIGTMEQILVSPVRPFQIIAGKVIPYIVLGFFDSVLVLTVAYFWFDVPIEGSLIFLGGSLILYILTGLSFGLLISTITKSQQIAMMAALLATILPTIMLSGFIFPVNSMPEILQYVALVVPATHFLEIIRGIMLKGIGLEELLKQTGYLILLSSILIAMSVKKFSTNLE